MTQSEADRNEWYEYLKNKIQSERWISGRIDYAFVHGQVLFARTAELITAEQANELSDMIPEY